jgi:cytoskeletal protein CcmA (bactofilin family)
MANQSLMETLDAKAVIADLGKGSEFQGKLTFEGAVRIDGRFHGEIFSEGILIIGETAQVKAEINVASVVVQGQLVGNIKAANCIELHSTCHLVGNIYSPCLYVQKGAIFEGNSVMDPRPQERRTPPPLHQ